MKLMYRNLSKGEYGCEFCIKNAEEIINRIDRRERVVIVLTPMVNIIHGEENNKATVHSVFMSYHIADGTDKYPFK